MRQRTAKRLGRIERTALLVWRVRCVWCARIARIGWIRHTTSQGCAAPLGTASFDRGKPVPNLPAHEAMRACASSTTAVASERRATQSASISMGMRIAALRWSLPRNRHDA